MKRDNGVDAHKESCDHDGEAQQSLMQVRVKSLVFSHESEWSLNLHKSTDISYFCKEMLLIKSYLAVEFPLIAGAYFSDMK